MDCVRWAVGEPEIVEQFRRDTGFNWRPGATPIDRAIDDATGVQMDFIQKFISWFNVNVWGPIDGQKQESL